MSRLAAALLACAGVAHADSSVTVTLNQQGQDLADQIGASVPDLITDAEARIDALFELQGLPRLLHSFANTAQLANHGLGVDYQVHPRDLTFGLVANSALANEASLSTDRVLSATVINYGLVAGANLGRWEHPRWSVFVTGSYASSTIRGLAGSLFSGAAHVQHQLVTARSRGPVEWTGLAVTTGLGYAQWKIGLASELYTNFTVTGTLDRATVGMENVGTLEVATSIIAAPLQVTTGVRLGGVLGLYVGGGVTLAGGSSTATAMLDTTLVINADHLPIGTATITASEEDGPNTATFDALAGFQLHTRHVRVFAQGAVSDGVRAVSLGLRGALN